MGGAQPLAVTMNEGVNITVEADLDKIKRRIKTGYLDKKSTCLDSAIKEALVKMYKETIEGTQSGNVLAPPGSQRVQLAQSLNPEANVSGKGQGRSRVAAPFEGDFDHGFSGKP